MADEIEFYCGDILVLAMKSSHAPSPNDLVNILKITYRVVGRTYTVDHAAAPYMRAMVCVINMIREDVKASEREQDVPS